MSLSLNRRIIEKIDEVEGTEVVKQFLKELLYFELQIIEEGLPRYKKRYDVLIEKYTKIYLESERR